MSAAQSPERTLSRLVAEQGSRRASGILTALRGKHKRLFCFQDGDLVFANSNMLEEQFVQHMKDKGWLDEKDNHTLDVVRDQGLVSESDLLAAMDSYIQHLLKVTLTWPDGEFEFVDGKPSLDGSITGRLRTTGFILEHVMNYPASMDKVRVRIGPPNIRVRTTARASREVAKGELDQFHLEILERCSVPAGLPDLAQHYPDKEDEVYRTVYGMLLTGLLKPAVEEKQGLPVTQVSREEALAWLAKEGREDHYGILGLVQDASRKMIRESYYELARKMHPDRFRSGPLQDLLGKVDSFFTYVTDAYNTLYDPDLRIEYDRQLEEKAAGRTREEKTDTAYVARQNLLRGRELAGTKKYNEAAGFLENALKLDGDNVEILTELGKLLTLNPRRRTEAEGYLLRAGELDPSYTESAIALAEFYVRIERYDDAASMCRNILKWEPGHDLATRILKELGKSGGKEGLFRGLFGG